MGGVTTTIGENPFQGEPRLIVISLPTRAPRVNSPPSFRAFYVRVTLGEVHNRRPSVAGESRTCAGDRESEGRRSSLAS